jgi:hypothetical protein
MTIKNIYSHGYQKSHNHGSQKIIRIGEITSYETHQFFANYFTKKMLVFERFLGKKKSKGSFIFVCPDNHN